MDLFQVVLFVSIVIGIFLIMFSLFIISSETKKEPDNFLQENNTIKALDASIVEIDRTMEELNTTSSAILEEIDEKYHELLFLYTLIDEKKNELADIYKGGASSPKDASKQKERALKAAPAQKAFENPHMQEILLLRDQGTAISDIAKRLNMGQGEVKLILELGKLR